MLKSLLMTRPEHDPETRYLCKWSAKVKDVAEKKGINVIDLFRKKARRGRFIGTINKVVPELVFLNGHGDADCVYGHKDEVILSLVDCGKINLKIIFTRSCKSAMALGKTMVAKKSADAFLGYQRKFWLAVNPENVSNPFEDETAALFLEPSNYVVIALLKGHTADYANEKAKEFFLRNIRDLLLGGPSSEDYNLARALHWNMINQVCLGDKNAKF